MKAQQAKQREGRAEAIEEAIEAFWKNAELQEAITFYGEWNGTALDEAYKKVKSDTIEKILSGDNELLLEEKSLAHLVEGVECFSAGDVLRLEFLRRELEKRGYKQVTTTTYEKA